MMALRGDDNIHMIGHWFDTVTDLDAGADVIRARRHGVVEVVGGHFRAVHLRPFPKLISLPEIWWVRRDYHCRGEADRCLLFYNQPRRFPNFIALKYVVSTARTPLATFRGALTVLDAIAQIKRTDALLCDVANTRISDRLLARWGWESHKPQWLHRNYIKRFYGEYPPVEVK
jgi:hypothetical protein